MTLLDKILWDRFAVIAVGFLLGVATPLVLQRTLNPWVRRNLPSEAKMVVAIVYIILVCSGFAFGRKEYEYAPLTFGWLGWSLGHVALLIASSIVPSVKSAREKLKSLRDDLRFIGL